MSDQPVGTPSRKIIFVHGARSVGGAEILRVTLLREMVARNWNVRVCFLVANDDLKQKIESAGVVVDELGNRGGLADIGGIRRLARYLLGQRPDIVQASQFLTNLQTSIAARLARVPTTIIEEHGIYKWKRWYHRLLDRWICARADAVIACSASVAGSAAASLRIPVEDIHVIHNCVGTEHLDPQAPGSASAGIRREIGVDEDCFVAVIVGTLRWEKGHKDLLEAWSMLHGEHRISENSLLLVVGDGPLEHELKELASPKSKVRFLGRRYDTPQILRSANLFVLPSRNEGFGIAIIEAMSAGIPVIATRSGGIPEIIRNGENGILVDPEQPAELARAVEQACRQSDRMADMARIAAHDVRTFFTPGVYADRLEEVYRQLES